MFKLFVAALVVFAGFYAKATAYHCNGSYAQSGSTYYHANGNHFKSGSTLYHQNGNYLKSGSTLYYPNGSYLKSGSTFYHANGNHLISGSTFYYANGNYLKSGSTCYYENGNHMGICPRTVTISNKGGDLGIETLVVDLENSTLSSYSVQFAGNGYIENYAIDMEGEILSLTSSCSDASDNIDTEVVSSVVSLFNQANLKTRDEIKSRICQ